MKSWCFLSDPAIINQDRRELSREYAVGTVVQCYHTYDNNIDAIKQRRRAETEKDAELPNKEQHLQEERSP